MKINYPTKKVYNKVSISHSNRGMNLEKILNQTNEFYIDNDIAFIYKKSIPIQIVKVDYPNRSSAIIKEAYYKVPSTTDYNGIYKGRYIDFEAKETKNKTSFPLQNIHSHQIKHLKDISNHGGIGFIIVFFSFIDEFYLLPALKVFEYWERMKKDRKSITLNEFREYGYLIEEGYTPRLDYLKIVDILITNEKA